MQNSLPGVAASLIVLTGTHVLHQEQGCGRGREAEGRLTSSSASSEFHPSQPLQRFEPPAEGPLPTLAGTTVPSWVPKACTQQMGSLPNGKYFSQRVQFLVRELMSSLRHSHVPRAGRAAC